MVLLLTEQAASKLAISVAHLWHTSFGFMLLVSATLSGRVPLLRFVIKSFEILSTSSSAFFLLSVCILFAEFPDAKDPELKDLLKTCYEFRAYNFGQHNFWLTF